MSEFSLLLKPSSADCNLACEYCFYLEKSSLYQQSKRHRMGVDVLERVVSTFMAEDMETYIFSWQGGEPTLLGLDFFKKVVELQARYGRSGAVVVNTLQTNGLLIDKLFASFLAKYKFLVGVSLDGTAAIHNYYRKNKAGRGTHAKVIKGIRTLQNAGVATNVLTVVNSYNSSKAVEIFNSFITDKLYYQQYIPCIEFTADNKVTDFSVTPEAWGEFLCNIFDLWYKDYREIVSIRLFDSIMQYYINGARNACTIGTECSSYLVVEYNGDIYPCDFYVEEESRLGNIMESEWEDFRSAQAYKNFGKRKTMYPTECIECDFVEICQGGCPRNRLSLEPDKKSYLCKGWQMFFRHALNKLQQLGGEYRQ